MTTREICFRAMLLSDSSTVCGCTITLLRQRLIFTGYLLLKHASSTYCIVLYCTVLYSTASTPCCRRDSTNVCYRSSSTCRRHVIRFCDRKLLCVICNKLLFGERAFRVVLARLRINCLATSVVSTTLTLLRKKLTIFFFTKL